MNPSILQTVLRLKSALFFTMIASTNLLLTSCLCTRIPYKGVPLTKQDILESLPLGSTVDEVKAFILAMGANPRATKDWIRFEEGNSLKYLADRNFLMPSVTGEVRATSVIQHGYAFGAGCTTYSAEYYFKNGRLVHIGFLKYYDGF